MANNQTGTSYSPVGIVGNVVGSFVSNIFKKPQTQDGFGKYCYTFGDPSSRFYKPANQLDPLMVKFMNKQPMTAKEKAQCTQMVLHHARNWTKAQKKSLEEACKNIRVIAEPVIKAPEVHTISASYSEQAQSQTIRQSRDPQEVVQAGIAKFPTWLFIVIGAVFFLPILIKGGKQ